MTYSVNSLTLRDFTILFQFHMTFDALSFTFNCELSILSFNSCGLEKTGCDQTITEVSNFSWNS